MKYDIGQPLFWAKTNELVGRCRIVRVVVIAPPPAWVKTDVIWVRDAGGQAWNAWENRVFLVEAEARQCMADWCQKQADEWEKARKTYDDAK